MTHPIGIILTSVDDASTAKTLARGLVDAQLAACVQVSAPGSSVYRWQGAVEECNEYYLVIKAPLQHCKAVMQWLGEHHPYDTPEIVVLEGQAAKGYAAWMQLVTLEAADLDRQTNFTKDTPHA